NAGSLLPWESRRRLRRTRSCERKSLSDSPPGQRLFVHRDPWRKGTYWPSGAWGHPWSLRPFPWRGRRAFRCRGESRRPGSAHPGSAHPAPASLEISAPATAAALSSWAYSLSSGFSDWPALIWLILDLASCSLLPAMRRASIRRCFAASPRARSRHTLWKWTLKNMAVASAVSVAHRTSGRVKNLSQEPARMGSAAEDRAATRTAAARARVLSPK